MFDALPFGLSSILVRFVIYGLLGWCIEVLFTGVSNAIFHRDRALTGKTYLWMHPVWGLTCLSLELLQDEVVGWSRWARLLVYVGVIYVSEFSFGWILRKTLGKCPWDYTGRGLNVMGLIRLDYAPAWLFAALFYEPLRTIVTVFSQPQWMDLLSRQLVAMQ